MEILAKGLLATAEPGTSRACLTFGTITPLQNGTLLATARAGDDKDSDLERIEFFRSTDQGTSWSTAWSPFEAVQVDGKFGTLKLCYLTELEPGHILAAAMWVDRDAHPGKPLFKAETEGCLPMAILLADSFDDGLTWTDWRKVAMPDELGPPSLTSPILKLANGSLAMSIETNKPYDDASKWMQKAVMLFSTDNGSTWPSPLSIAEDETGRIFNWDLRLGVGVDGQIASFAWTYDTETEKYQNIHRRIGSPDGKSWSEPQDLGFADQAGPPAMLDDGKVLLAYVDRFDSQSIKARLANTIDGAFDPESEITLYANSRIPTHDAQSADMGELLVGMEMWSFGLPYACVLPDGDVLVVNYAGDAKAMSLHWTRIRP